MGRKGTMQVEASKESKAKKTKGGKSRKNEIGGFLVDRVRGDVMRAFVEENGLGDKIETDVSDEMLGVAISQHFSNTTSKEAQVQCDVNEGGCGGVSSDALESCPYCGDLGEVESSDEAAETASDRSDVDEDDEEDDDEDEVEAASDVEEDLDEDEDDDGDDEAEEDDEEEIEAAPPPAPKKTAVKTKKEEKMQTETVNGSGLKKGRSTALVSTKELDTKVSEVRKWQKAIAESTFEGATAYWHLGKSLLDIYEGDLHKLRTDDKGKPLYKSWDVFCKQELGMSPQHAYSAIDVAKGYENPEEVHAIGQSKAAKILQAAPEDRPALKEKAKAGAPLREISKEVKESRKKHGSPKKSQQAKAGSKGGTNKAKARSSEKVSIVSFEGTKTIKMYKKPETLKNVQENLAKCKRAKTLGDQPFGIFEMANGIVQHYFILVKDGEISLRVETRRLET